MELTLKEIALFYGCCNNTAKARVKEIKTYFGMNQKGRILKWHLAYYEGIPLKDIDLMLSDL